MSELAVGRQEHFSTVEQQREAAHMGMWLFLMTEVMFFGGLFTAFEYYRMTDPVGFETASRYAELWLGAGNTAVLLLSSLTMALAVRAAKLGQRRAIMGFLVLTMILGTVFLGLKGLEYSHHIHDHLFPGQSFHAPDATSHATTIELFFYLYFTMTGLHALHMIIGLAVVSVMVVLAWRGRITADYPTPVELTGLYWHFVDIVWIFLFPMFYLAGKR